MSKIVLCPIEVPEGKYCWQHAHPFEICEHFNNDNGYASCNVFIIDTDKTNEGVLKPKACSKLKEPSNHGDANEI